MTYTILLLYVYALTIDNQWLTGVLLISKQYFNYPDTVNEGRSNIELTAFSALYNQCYQ